MTDFESELAARLARNDELADDHRSKRQAMRDWEEQRDADAQAEAARLAREREQRHAELAAHVEQVAARLKESAPEQFVVRVGWTESHQQLIARLSTRLLEPARTLLLELDLPDDEVLARWTSDVGSSLELWRLLEVDADLLTQLVLQVADQDLWRTARRPPPYPGAPDLADEPT